MSRTFSILSLLPAIEFAAPVRQQRSSLWLERINQRHSGWLGQFRRDSGWGEWAEDPRYRNQHWRMDSVFARARQVTT
jgi:hypothetical protein